MENLPQKNQPTNELSEYTKRQELTHETYSDSYAIHIPTLRRLELINKQELEKEIIKHCVDFLILNSDGENIALIAQAFAKDIIETRYDWKISEIPYFFKWIRQNRSKSIEVDGVKISTQIFGNKVTLLKLMDMVLIYEDYRGQQREDWHKRFKPCQPTEKPNIASIEEAKVYIDKIFENVKPIKKVCQPSEKNSAYWIVQEYLEEFDRLFNSQQNTCEGIRYVVIEGVKYDIDKYLRLRMEPDEVGEGEQSNGK